MTRIEIKNEHFANVNLLNNFSFLKEKQGQEELRFYMLAYLWQGSAVMSS